MEPEVRVHPRVHIKRPDITDDDARAAFSLERRVRAQTRVGTVPPVLVGVGLDMSARHLEWIAAPQEPNGWLIYHCAPETNSILQELGLTTKRRKR